MHTFKGDDYEWDQAKADANLAKHGIDFADAFSVFADPRAITLSDDRSEEERYLILGMDVIGRLVVVAYTWRGDRIRIISARKATTSEARLYAARKP